MIQALQEKGIDVNLNIVGFAIDDAELEAQFRSWAEQGGGRYFSARDQSGLSDALREALARRYVVYDATGSVVADGRVDGDAVEVDEGYYRADVLSTPGVPGEEVVTLTLQ